MSGPAEGVARGLGAGVKAGADGVFVNEGGSDGCGVGLLTLTNDSGALLWRDCQTTSSAIKSARPAASAA